MTRYPIFFALFILTLSITFHRCARKSDDGGTDIVIGSSVTFYSEIYDREIRLSISLPVDYHEDTRSYPVFYSLHTNFLHNAGAIKQIADNVAPALIYIHLETYNSGDLLPSKIESRPTSGQADRLLDFYRRELFPFIESHYRTQPFRIIHSGSWGGVFCLYTLMTQPDLFNAYLVSTPWLIYDDEHQYMLRNSEHFLRQATLANNSLFLALGNDPEPGLRESVESLVQILSGEDENRLRMQYSYWPEEDHYSIGHKTVYDGLRWLFLPYREMPESVALDGPAAVQRYREELALQFGYDIGVHPGTLSNLGYRFLEQNRFDQAIEMFSLCVDLSPNLPHYYVQLGRAYEAKGSFQEARENYTTARDQARAQNRPDLPRYDDYLSRISEKMSASSTDTQMPD